MRKIFYWKLRNSELPLGERTLIMGVLNVTPDSFSDGGLYRDPDRAYARVLELEQEGADIIDIGAESTRPGASRISADEEWQRLVPVLKRLRGNVGVPLSLDTYKSETAERALDYGIEIINDPSGLTFDANLAKAAASGNAGLILNHMRGTPESWAKLPPLPDAPGTVARDLEATVSRARRAGVEQNRIVIDPGIGFGKRGEQNAELIAHLGELARLELPILVGPSRKSFLRQITDGETLFATAAAVTAAILKGAHIVRVHDVKQMRACVLVADEIARAAAELRVQPERPAQRPERRPALREGRTDRVFAAENPRPPRPPLAIPTANGEPKTVELPSRADAARTESERPRERPARDARFDGGRDARIDRGRDRAGVRPPREDRARDARPRDARPRDARPGGDRPREGRGENGRMEGGPPRTGRGPGDRPPKFGPPRGDRRPPGDRPRQGRPGDTRPPRDGRPAREGRPPREGFQGRRDGPPRGDGRPDQNRPPRGEQPRGEKPRSPRPPTKRVFRKRP